ncbi:peroxisomal bifunctional enzyme isoform X2 [Conger conger]|uniref:peroxisomal bifunctional enzyme isoform X2 n=1 Tax=Conger conger TaxID=82655 RepID=UPI002A59E6C7|nr:peroxisomal bifunctional enzyme isoform X2 [Conger conger]
MADPEKLVVFKCAAVRQGITDTVSRAVSDPEVKGVVLCGENGKFCGGADIKEFGGQMKGPHLVPMIDAIEATAKPVVAAIEGMALGGGLELALACHYRIAHVKALLGLPEVALGLLPGAGGTQRLPRLIGVPAALDLITTGRHVSAQEALKLGIVDRITAGNTLEVAAEFVRSVSAEQRLALPRLSTCPTPCPPDLDSFLERAMAQVRRRARGALAPVACVQAVRAAATLPYSQGMRVERELMATLFKSQQARAMQYCFFSQRSVGRWSTPSGARWDNSSPLPVQNAAVIGLGTMGRGIVVSFARAGIPVVGVEMDAKQLEISRRAVTSMLERDARRQGAELPEGLVRFTTDLRDLREVDLVIEAVFEDMALKKRVFGELSSVCRPDTLLCSNTSTLDLDQLAAATHRPELVVGMHFFSPANVMKLLEVIYGSRSAPAAVATAMQLGKRLGKVSVAVGNCHGFVGNRMVLPYMSQANFLVEEGATPEQVDQVLEEFGFSMGVFRMSDLAGLDVGWRIRKELGLTGPGVAPGEPARSRKGSRYSPLADLLCEQGRLGQKTGCGWYLYDRPGGREAKPDPWMRGFLEEYRSSHGLRARPVDQQEVLERCLYALVNEGFRVLEDGIAAGPEDVDVIYVLGYGWPPHRGGPMFHAAAVGLPAVLDRLEHYHQAHPDVPGLQPSALLRKLVARGSPPIHKWREVIKNIRSQL